MEIRELNASSEPRYKQPKMAVPVAEKSRDQVGVCKGAGAILLRWR